MNEKYMKIALNEAKKSLKTGDVPIGTIIVCDNKIIARAHNMKEYKNDPTKHAEIIAIQKATNKLGTWHLDNCIMYSTLEPCLMCSGALIQSRIKKIVYAADNEKFGYAGSINNILNNKKNNHIVDVESGLLKEESIILLQNFFKDKR